jgi:Protein of unknown function (DUF3634)
MGSFVFVMVIAGVTAALLLAAARACFVFVVKIEGGIPRATRGKVAVHFLRTIAEVCQRHGVQAGWIAGIRKGRRITLAFSHGIPAGCRQQLRNEWVIAG